MAYSHGKVANFQVDDSGGTLRDISAYCRDVTFSSDLDTAEVSTFGDSAKEYLVGMYGATFSVSGVFDNTATTGPDAVLGGLISAHPASVTFKFGPEGSTACKIQYTGEAIMTSYEVSSSIGDANSFSANFTVTGAITRTTY